MFRSGPRWLIFCGTLVLAAPMLPVGRGQGVDPTMPRALRKTDLDWDNGANKSYVVPALEIPVFLGALNLYDRAVYGKEVYGSTARTT